MMHGVAASIPYAFPDLGDIGNGPGEASLDFVAGVYKIEGTTYAFDDIFEAATTNTEGTSSATVQFDGRGFASFYRSGLPFADFQAKGPLLALLSENAKTYVFEWEDQAGSGSAGPYFDDGGTDYFLYTGIYGDVLSLDFNDYNSSTFTYIESVTGTGEPFAPYGVNRAAFSYGSTQTSASFMGSNAPAGESTTAFIAPGATTRFFPMGCSYDGGDIGGYVRRVDIVPAVTLLADLTFYSARSTPANITDLAAGTITDTTIAVTFTTPSGATGAEYFVAERPFGGGAAPASALPGYNLDPSENAWSTLTGGTITGLEPGTNYTIIARPTNAAGPGGGQSIDVTTTGDRVYVTTEPGAITITSGFVSPSITPW